MAETQSVFFQSLQSSPHTFLTPDLPLQTDILQYVKDLLDPIAAEISATQQERQKEVRRKRKRGDPSVHEEPLRLKQVHVSGLGVEQVWEQTRRILDATRQEAQRTFETLQQSNDQDVAGSDVGDDSLRDVQMNSEDEAEEESEEESLGEDLDSDGDITKDALDDSDELDDVDEVTSVSERAEEFVQDKFGLNDGFFSIDDFNRQSEFLEQQDARGNNDGAASDEEDVDWDTDPLGMANVTPAASGRQAHDDAASEEEGGPTFGDPDAPSEDEDAIDQDDMDGIGDFGNTNDILYRDFFAPPAQKVSKKKKQQQQERKPRKPDTRDDDIQRTMEAVQRDLFDDEDENEEEEEETEQLDPADPRSRKSAHERRQAALAEEIRKLESANVAKREWTMSGEARAADRPINSLLEEDLDFERTGKPVPIITAEVSESIEELIKRRILAQDFQDILRRRPDDLATRNSRRGQLDFVLDNTQSKKGLADQYEEEHLRKTDPAFVDVKDEKLAKEQREIEALWNDICGKLDSLSSWHFRPKRPTAQLDVRVDAPTITMEDARPNAGGEISVASQLAPQEVYKGGEGSKGENHEVVGKSGLPAGRKELSREDKKRRRRREKERIHKANTNTAAKQESQGAQQNQQKKILGDLQRGNVKIVGKKGELTDVGGNAVASDGTQTAARFKL